MKGRHLGSVFSLAIIHLACLAPTGASGASVSPAVQITWHRSGLLTWQRDERRAIAPPTIHRLTINLGSGRTAVIAAGSPGILVVRVRYAQRDGGPVRRSVLWARVARAPRPRIVAEGIGGTPLSSFEARGLIRMAYMARSAILMLATGYTADSAGGTGMTAIGRRAGFGIVAVDPRVIPLGTRLFIAGYGFAIAGDTGGDIVGRRIDLGFDSLRDAMLFGRRAVTVYPLK